MPRLSVIMPYFNHAAYLADSVGSVLAQSFTDFELILIDDASTDGSGPILSAWAQKDSRIRLLRNAQQEGPASACNRGVHLAQGEFLHFFAADDLLVANVYEKSLAALSQYPEMALCTSDFGFFYDGESKIHSTPLCPGISTLSVYSPTDFLTLCQTKRFSVPGHTTLMQKEAFLHLSGGFRPEFTSLCDWVTHHTVALIKGVIYLPETLVAMRLKRNSYSTQLPYHVKVQNILSFFSSLDQDPFLKEKFAQSTLLTPLLRTAWKTLLRKPSYWPLFFPVIQKKLHNKIQSYANRPN